MHFVDLNSDLGESFGSYKLGRDEDILPLITSANIACGFHAGDPSVMDRTVRLAAQAGCSIGAHPGYPDLMGFGRRNMSVSPEEAKAYIIYQVGALMGFCRAHGVQMHHVKPHGALYNMAAKDARLAEAICQGIRAVDPELRILALAGSAMVKAAEETGLPYAAEVFADRAYMPDGTLVPRSRPDAMITDEAEACRRVVQMVKCGTVEAVDGTVIPIKADSICVHGDNEKALQFVLKIRSALAEEDIGIRTFE